MRVGKWNVYRDIRVPNQLVGVAPGRGLPLFILPKQLFFYPAVTSLPLYRGNIHTLVEVFIEDRSKDMCYSSRYSPKPSESTSDRSRHTVFYDFSKPQKLLAFPIRLVQGH